MTSPDDLPRASVRGARLLTGLSRAQERRLRSLWLEEWGTRVVARCGSAAQLLDVRQRGEGDVVLVDEDLHRFDSGHRAALWQVGTPLVALVREPQDVRWRDVPGLLLPLDAEMPAVLDALERAAHGERASRMHKPSSGAQEATTPTVAGVALPTRLQVLALSGDLDSHEAWRRELDRALQPLGPYAKHGQVLCGLPRGRQRLNVSAAFVERLVAELRTRFTFVVLDVGPEPPAESQVTAAALRAADQVLVVATPDPPGLYRARSAVHDAAAILDRSRAALVLNRYDPRVHTDLRKVDSEIGLPILSLVPDDARTVQRALLAGQPAVCEPSSRIRAPLLDLVDRVAAGQVGWPQRDPWAAPPLWARVRASMAASPLSLLGGGSGR